MTNFSKVITFLVFASITLLVSCKKDALNSVSPSVSARQSNVTPLENLISDPNDKENENIDRQNVEIAKVLLEISKSKEFSNFIVKTAKANSGTVKYAQIFEKFPDLLPKFDNTVIAKRFAKSNSFIEESDYDFVHAGYAYESVIFLPNYETIPNVEIDVDGLIVSPAIEVDDDIANENYDLIYSWELQSDGSSIEVNIGSKDAETQPTPIFTTGLNIVGNLSGIQPVELTKQTQDNSKHNSTSLETRATSICNTDSYVLNEFYDKTRSQEFCGVGIQRFTTSGATSGTTKGIGESVGSTPQPNNWFIKSVSRNETGRAFLSGVGPTISYAKIFYPILATTTIHFVYYNTYEWDWYATKKPMGTVRFSGIAGVQRFESRRKYYEEWFTFDPGPDCGRDNGLIGTLSHVRNARFPSSNMHSSGQFTEIFDQNKGSLLFKRKNP